MSGALAPFGTAAEIVEEDPPGGPGTAVLVVFRDGGIETFEDPELCRDDEVAGYRKERTG